MQASQASSERVSHALTARSEPYQHDLRALRTLRDEGLLEFRRDRGITVCGTPQHRAIRHRVNQLVDYARANGYPTP